MIQADDRVTLIGGGADRRLLLRRLPLCQPRAHGAGAMTAEGHDDFRLRAGPGPPGAAAERGTDAVARRSRAGRPWRSRCSTSGWLAVYFALLYGWTTATSMADGAAIGAALGEGVSPRPGRGGGDRRALRPGLADRPDLGLHDHGPPRRAADRHRPFRSPSTCRSRRSARRACGGFPAGPATFR